MKAALLILALISTACVNVKEVGKDGKPVTVFHASANVEFVDFTSANGSRLIMRNADPAKTHKAVGSAIGQGALSVGTAIATSGILPAVKP